MPDQWLNQELRTFHEKVANEYFEQLNEEVDWDLTVENYVRHYYNYDLSDGSVMDNEIDDLPTNETDIKVFQRCFPYFDQDLMLVTNNPGMPDPVRYFLVGEGMLYSRGSNDPKKFDEMAKIGGHHIVNWLSDNSRFTNRLETIAEHWGDVEGGPEFLRLDEDEYDVSEYFQLERTNVWKHWAYRNALIDDDSGSDLIGGGSHELRSDEGFFADFYYSVAYKYSTRGSGQIPDISVEDLLYEEINIVEPKTVFVSGSTPWDWIRKHDQKSESDPANDSEYDAYNLSLIAHDGDSKLVSGVTDSVSTVEWAVFEERGTAPLDFVVVCQHPSRMKTFDIPERFIKKIKQNGVF